MKIDIICPLYNAENYIKDLDESIKKQENVNIDNIRYILTKSKDRTEEILKNINAKYKKIEQKDFSHSLTREKEAYDQRMAMELYYVDNMSLKLDAEIFKNTVDSVINKKGAI